MRCPCKDCKDRAINGHVTCIQAVRGTANMRENAKDTEGATGCEERSLGASKEIRL